MFVWFEVLILFSIFMVDYDFSWCGSEIFWNPTSEEDDDDEEDLRSEMEFTDAYKQTGPCCFSPNARFLAVAVDYRLVIRDVLTLKVIFPPCLSFHLFPFSLFGSSEFSFSALSLFCSLIYSVGVHFDFALCRVCFLVVLLWEDVFSPSNWVWCIRYPCLIGFVFWCLLRDVETVKIIVFDRKWRLSLTMF